MQTTRRATRRLNFIRPGGMMREESERRPSLGDAMIVVVASALALSITRYVVAEPTPLGEGGPAAYRAAFAIERWALPWLLTLAWAALAIRLRRPRPAIRRVWRQPGAVGSVLAAVASLYAGMLMLARRLKAAAFGQSVMSLTSDGHLYLGMTFFYGGAMIAGGWISLVLSGRFRRRDGWIDGLGIAVGTAWIVADVALTLCQFVLA